MSTRCTASVAGWTFAAVLCIPSAAAAEVQGAAPVDDTMSCDAIAAELAPYAQQMMPNIQALGATQMQLYAQTRPRLEERKAEHEALTPLATAGALDKTGAAKRAYEMALMAQTAKERAEDEAMANSPLALQGRAQTTELAAQAQQMQSNARLQRLMQLAQQRHCDKR